MKGPTISARNSMIRSLFRWKFDYAVVKNRMEFMLSRVYLEILSPISITIYIDNTENKVKLAV